MDKQTVDESNDRRANGESFVDESTHLLLEQLQDGYFEIDEQGRLLFANGVFLKLFDIRTDHLRTIHLADILSPDPSQGRILFNELIHRPAIATPVDLSLVDSGGHAHKVTLTLVGFRDPSGTAKGFQGVVRHGLSKEKMAAGLARTKSFLQNIINSSMEGVAATDMQNTLAYVSPRIVEMTGYSKEELMGAPLVKLFRAGEYDVRLIDRALREEGALRDHETQLLTREGDPLDVSLSVSILKDETRVTLGSLIICRDVTESKRLEAQLRFGQRMEAIGTLAGGIAHNFNNLLMGIQGNTSLMMLDTDPDHPNFKRILNVEKHIQSGSRLTRQLIGYAREGKYQVQTIDLNHTIRETSEAFALTKRGIEFVYDLDSDLPGAMADRGQIEQVLMNLLVNAVDAMPDGGRITIGTRAISHVDLMDKPYHPAPGQYISISVADTGLGMDGETCKRVFEPFFTTKGLDRGNGLGLASCYGVIKAHGGYIDVESQPGQGSCFTIFLPGSNQAVTAECEESDQCFPGNETILVVDDENMILEVTREMLELLGYQVLTAESGGQAIRMYREQGASINLVILDMIMPDMGGDKTFEALRHYDPNIKVLLASGYSMEGKAVVLLDQGCAGFIQKPFDLPSISQKLREILDRE